MVISETIENQGHGSPRFSIDAVEHHASRALGYLTLLTTIGLIVNLIG